MEEVKMNKILKLIMLITMALVINQVRGQKVVPGFAEISDTTQAGKCDKSKVPKNQWFTDARFGMFIHWGVYAIPARGEWVMHSERMSYNGYEEIARTFKPTGFDARKIVSMAKGAGMKYLVITAKHHDGFCMWDTKLTDYNITRWAPTNPATRSC